MKLLAKKLRANWVVVFLIVIFLIVGMWWLLSVRTPSSPATNTTNTNDKNPAPVQNKDLEDCLLQASNSDANSTVIEQARQHCYETYR